MAEEKKTQKKQRVIKPKPSLEPGFDGSALVEGNSKFARALGSTDFHTREKGLAALTRWLTRKSEVKHTDMLKIWKGLFYCFWHSDKAPVQQELATRLAGIMPLLNEETGHLYFTVFIQTMRREWFGIDRLRLDKFLMLVRKFFNQLLVSIKARKWDIDVVSRYATFFQHHVLQPSDNLPAMGLAYHFCDILLSELSSVADGKALSDQVLRTFLAPFLETLKDCEQTMLLRIREAVFEPLMESIRSPGDEDSAYMAKLDVEALATAAFDAGAVPDLLTKNRLALYDLSAAIEKSQKKRRKVAAGTTEAAAVPPPQREQQPLSSGPAKQGKVKIKGGQVVIAKAEPVSLPMAAPDAAPAAAASDKKQKKRKLQEESEQEQPQQPQQQQQQVGPGPMSAKQAPSAAKAGGKPPVPITTGQKAALRATIKAFALHSDAADEEQEQGRKASHAKAGSSSKGSTPLQAQAQAQGGSGSKVLGKLQQQEEQQAAEVPARKAQTAVKPALKPGQGRAGGSGSVGPVSGATGAKAAPHTTGKPVKKGVTINLKKNLYFEFGGPVPDPDVRTPPPARAKGSILKTSRSHGQVVGAPSVPASAPPKQNAGSDAKAHAKQHVTPKSVPRAKASLFF